MPLATIADNESGASVRASINAAIAQANSLSVVSTGNRGVWINVPTSVDLSSKGIVSVVYTPTTLTGTLYLQNNAMDQTEMDVLIAYLAANLTTGGGTLDVTTQSGGGQASLSPDIGTLEAIITVIYD